MFLILQVHRQIFLFHASIKCEIQLLSFSLVSARRLHARPACMQLSECTTSAAFLRWALSWLLLIATSSGPFFFFLLLQSRRHSWMPDLPQTRCIPHSDCTILRSSKARPIAYRGSSLQLFLWAGTWAYSALSKGSFGRIHDKNQVFPYNCELLCNWFSV